jgi:uncharacterized membrane protein YeaQ/YmgE (transglycosylase-associated protein family)
MGKVDAKAVAVFLAVGFAAGWLASLLVGGGGLIRNIIIGVLGSFVGGFLLNAFNVKLGISNPLLNQIVTGAIGAIVVVIIARILAW